MWKGLDLESPAPTQMSACHGDPLAISSLEGRGRGVPGTSWLPRLAELVSSELKRETLPIEISDGEWLGKTPHVSFQIPYLCAHMSTHTLESLCTRAHRHLKIHVQAHT